MTNDTQSLKRKKSLAVFIASMALALLLTMVLAGCSGSGNSPSSATTNSGNSSPSAAVGSDSPSSADAGDGDAAVDGDLVINTADISATAAFYPVEVDGTKLEVIAVEAPDGTIRTAFNTCRVCYDSGRGYYKQDGNVLVCQNCGNRFTMSQVEVVSGGCNPVPIFPENKTVTDETITVSLDFLQEAKGVFSNWRSEY